jgi:hypothetical protein
MMKNLILNIEIELRNIEENISKIEIDMNNIIIRIENNLKDDELDIVYEDEAPFFNDLESGLKPPSRGPNR